MKNTRQKIFSSIFLSLVAIMFLFSCANRDITTLIEEIKPAVVTIITFGLQKRSAGIVDYWELDTLGQGSGFFINPEGYIVTNYHVLKGADSAIIKTVDNKVYVVKGVIAEDRGADLVMVTTDAPKDSIEYIKISAELPKEGENILVIGSPLGLEHTVSNGIVSSIRDIEDFGKLIQITAPISPGSSGGPVVNQKGNVIGVASYHLIGGENLNFAISGQKVKLLKPYPFEEKELSIWTADIMIEELSSVKELLGRGTYCHNLDAKYIYYKKALEVQPNNPEVYQGLAGYYTQRNCYDDAINYAKKAIQLDPYNSDHYAFMAGIQRYFSYYDDAVENYKRAILLNPDDPFYLRELALTLSENNQYDGAIKTMKKALYIYDKRGRYPSSYSLLSLIYRKAGRYSDAIKTGKRLIELIIKYHRQKPWFRLHLKSKDGFYFYDYIYISDSLRCAINNNELFGYYAELAEDYLCLNDTAQAYKIYNFLKERDTTKAKELYEKICPNN